MVSALPPHPFASLLLQAPPPSCFFQDSGWVTELSSFQRGTAIREKGLRDRRICLMLRCGFPQPETLFLLYLADPAQPSGLSFTVMVPKRPSLTLVPNKGSLLHPLCMRCKTLCYSFIAATTVHNPTLNCLIFFFFICRLQEGRGCVSFCSPFYSQS